MRNKTTYRRGVRKPELAAQSISLRILETQYQHLKEKRRRSRLYNEQEYLRILLDLGIQAELSGVKPQSGKAQTSSKIKQEIIDEVTEVLQVNLKQTRDAMSIEMDKLAERVTGKGNQVTHSADNAASLNKIDLIFRMQVHLEEMAATILEGATTDIPQSLRQIEKRTAERLKNYGEPAK